MIKHVRRHVRSYKYAAQGVHYTLTSQVNIWFQLSASAVVLALALWLNFSLERYIILLLTIGFVISIELINTALEEMTNLLSPEYRDKAGIVKDVSAGAVLVAAITAALIGVILFLPPLVDKLS